jgi:hypothetical protein
MLHTVRLIVWPFLFAPDAFHQRKGERITMSNRSQRPIEATASTPHVHVVNHHSIVLFHLNTPVASAWVEEHVSDEAQFFGMALVVEPRYVADLIHGMHEAGLEVR